MKNNTNFFIIVDRFLHILKIYITALVKWNVYTNFKIKN